MTFHRNYEMKLIMKMTDIKANYRSSIGSKHLSNGKNIKGIFVFS